MSTFTPSNIPKFNAYNKMSQTLKRNNEQISSHRASSHFNANTEINAYRRTKIIPSQAMLDSNVAYIKSLQEQGKY